MRLRQFLVLEAVNIASTRYRRKKHDFECTAAQIAYVINTDKRFEDDGYSWELLCTNGREVGEQLKQLSKDQPVRREPLVEKVDSRRWRLTDAGIRVLSA